MGLRYWMVALVAVAGVSCAHTDPPEATVVAAATPPSHCADPTRPGQDECDAKTMAGQRAPSTSASDR
jgi:hypothetical protein